jgi:hypothetical protein
LGKERECATDDIRIEKCAEDYEYQGDSQSYYHLGMSAPLHPFSQKVNG